MLAQQLYITAAKRLIYIPFYILNQQRKAVQKKYQQYLHTLKINANILIAWVRYNYIFINIQFSVTNNFDDEPIITMLTIFIFVCGQLKSKESSLNHPGWIGLWQKR